MNRIRRTFRLFFPWARFGGILFWICFWGWSCSHNAPPPTSKLAPPTPPPLGTQRPYEIKGVWYYPLPSAAGYREKGLASWYGRKWHGRKTASGERYNMYALTAAHKTLPMGTHVKVTHLKTKRSVVVRINDRGPFVKGRIIDLSYKAAKILGIDKDGVAPVEIEVVRVASPVQTAGSTTWRVDPLAQYTKGHFAVQVGSFLDIENARKLKDKLTAYRKDVRIRMVRLGPNAYYRVHVGTYTDLNRARESASVLQQMGFDGAFVIAVEDK